MIDLFEDYYDEIKYIPEDIRDDIDEILFCYRKGINSITIIFTNYESFEKVVKDVPDEIKKHRHKRYGVDLKSLNTDMVRLYTNPYNANITGLGFYVKDGKVFETKEYYGYSDGIKIKRYDDEKLLLREDESEKSVPISQWKGPSEVLDLIKKLELGEMAYCIAKTYKDQSYLGLPVPRYE